MPRNVRVLPEVGGLLVIWDPPEDLGNPGGDTLQYVVQIKPVVGEWDCNPTTNDNANQIAVYCADIDGNGVIDHTTEGGWATIFVNLSGALPEDPFSEIAMRLRFLDDDVEYEVRVAAEGPRVEDPDNPGTYVRQRSDFSDPPVTETPGLREPGVPQNLSLTPGNEMIDVAWDAPQDPGDPEMDGYVVRWREVTTPEPAWTRLLATSASAELTVLDNGTEYEVEVAAFHTPDVDTSAVHLDVTFYLAAPGTGVECSTVPDPDPNDATPTAVACYVVVADTNIGDYTASESATPSAERLPGQPQSLQLRPGNRSITVLWDAPQDDLGNPDLGNPELDGYVVQWQRDGESAWESVVLIGIDTDTELDDLDNGVAYQVRVAAFHKLSVTRTEGVEVVPVLAASDVPDPEAGEDSIPECPTDGTAPTADCYVVIPSGQPGQTEDYVGDFTAPVKATPSALTLLTVIEEVDPNTPLNLVLTPGVAEIKATWDRPSMPDASHTGYVVQYRAAGSTAWIDATRIEYGDTDNDPETPVVTDSAALRTAVITGLAEGTYQVRVGSLLSQGGGRTAGSFTAPKTAEAAAGRPPGAPRNVKVEIETSPNDGSRRIEVSWDPPEDVGNPPGIVGYKVQYRPVTDPESEWSDWPHEGTGTKTTITGIDAGHRSYEVRVLTIGVAGNTGEAAKPEFGAAVRPPTAPKSLTLTPGDGQIEAEWEPPEDLGHPPITGYIVSYRLDGTPTWQQFHQSGRSKTFTGLTNGSLYHVRVWVSNYVTGTGAFIELAVEALGAAIR